MAKHTGLIDIRITHSRDTIPVQALAHLIVSGNEAKDVVIAQHAVLIDLNITHPRDTIPVQASAHLIVSGNEAEDVVMAQHAGLIDIHITQQQKTEFLLSSWLILMSAVIKLRMLSCRNMLV